MSDHGTPPVIPTQFQQYNSYAEDPKWQIKFTIIWTSILAASVLFYVPYLLRLRTRWFTTFFGIRENSGTFRYERVGSTEKEATDKEITLPTKKTGKVKVSTDVGRGRNTRQWMTARLFYGLGVVFYWTVPGLNLSAGHIFLIAGYLASVLACIVTQAPLISNPNRAGFLALAQLPPIFLLGTKNSLLSLLLPPSFSYTRLNPLHRWAGRSIFLAAVIHGSLWIRNHLQWNIPIIGQQKETSGVAALGVLCVLMLGSLKWVRSWCWGVFYWIHFLAFPSFFITVCYHTIYAAPWIIPPLAFYAFDLVMRQLRYRIKDAQLIRVDNQMTLIRISDAMRGFRAGQHLRLRVFFDGRGVFESHPFSIMNASSGSSCLRASDLDLYGAPTSAYDKSSREWGGGMEETPGLVLGVRVRGDWTKALNEYALKECENAQSFIQCSHSSSSSTARRPLQAVVPVQVMFDGPYGGCTLDLPSYERVLLVAGGSGATFAVGALDELVASCCLSEGMKEGVVKTEKVVFVWCIKSSASIKWIAPLLNAIAMTASKHGLDLGIIVYVTCLCVPEEVPDIPGMEVRMGGRPDMGKLVGKMVGGDGDEEGSRTEGKGDGADEGRDVGRDVESARSGQGRVRFDGCLGMCASGPASLTVEAANAVARFGGRVGGRVGLHTEVFAI